MAEGKGFGILIKGSNGTFKDLADRVLPTKETLSKPIPKDKSPVEHYMHEFKHQIGKNPPQSREQAIAIGMSVEKQGKQKRKRKKEGEHTSKALIAPGVDEDSTQKWRPAPRSKLNRMRLWDKKHGKWVYRDRTSNDDAVWGTPPGGTPSPPPRKEPEESIEPSMVGSKKESLQERQADFDQQKVRDSGEALDKLLQQKKKVMPQAKKVPAKPEKKDIPKKPAKRMED